MRCVGVGYLCTVMAGTQLCKCVWNNVGVNLMLLVIRPPQRAAFNFWIPQWRWLHKLGRRMGFIPLMFSGIWGIPYAMPAPTPLNLVVGKPIVVPKMEGEDRSCAWSV
jgi:hypothetical protein